MAMGEFLHRSRQSSDKNKNLHQSQQTQLKPSESKTEAQPEEKSSIESSFESVMQRKWDSFGGEDENRNQRRGPVPSTMVEDDEPPIQRRGPVPIEDTEEEEPIQRLGPVPLQFHSSKEDEEPIQRKGPVPPMNMDSDDHSDSDSSSSDRMPFLVQRKMESSFGEDFSDVNIQKDSSQSTELNAHAFAIGNDIHFAPGMYNPESQKGQELLGHELTHVVQQREGRVQPTVQKKGENINDDEGLEKEADEMGAKAAKGESVTEDSNTPAEDKNETPNVEEQQNESGTIIIVGVNGNMPVGNREEIMKIQSSLKALGYYQGSEDGYITRKDGKESDTVKAVKNFQREHQLAETGNVDASTNSLIDNLVSTLPQADNIKEVPTSSDQKNGSQSLEAFFVNYENFARIELNHWYSKDNSVPKDKTIDASYFSKEARRIYKEKGDLKYVVPIQYALAQLKLEGGLKGAQRSASNVFNVHAYDSGVTKEEKEIDTLEKGFSAYYSLMAERFLTDKGADSLLENGKFLNKDGGVYATNPFYEIEIKSEIGFMYYRASDYILSASVGAGGMNKPGDVKIVGSLLNKAGFLSEDKIENLQAVSSAILAYQKQEMVPKDEKWFKEREKEVKDQTDKDNVETKKNKFADGCIGTKGQTIGLLYYQTILNNKIPDLTLERDKEKLEKGDKKEVAHTNKESKNKAPVSKEEIKKQTENSTKPEEKRNQGEAGRKLELPKILFEKYNKGEISLIALGKGLMPHTVNNGSLVLQVFEQMEYWQRDNLAYVMTISSSDSFLGRYNRELLGRMAEYLSGYFNTHSWGENAEQATRINKILNKEAKVQEGNAELRKVETERTSDLNPVKSQKELQEHFKGGKNSGNLPKVYGSRTNFNPYLKENKLNASVGNGGINNEKDVALVIAALKAHNIVCTKELDSLVEAIKKFQKEKMKNPDGNISPTGKTAEALGLSMSSGLTIGRVERSKNSKGEYVYGKGTETTDYYKKVDLIEKNIGVKQGSKEEYLLHAAREAHGNSKFFDEFTKGIKAKLNWGNATKSLEGHSLNSLLETRITKFHKFCVAAGLYNGDMLIMDAVRPPKTAHRYSAEHFIGYTNEFEGQIKKNLVDMYNDSKHRMGNDVIDSDGNVWAKKEQFKFDEGKATSVNYGEIKKEAQSKRYRKNPSSVAAEGYDSGREERLPLPVSGKPGKSLHTTGNALDVNSQGFVYRDGGITDLIALNFGLVRAAPGEQWHFECTDLRVSTSEQEVIEQEKR